MEKTVEGSKRLNMMVNRDNKDNVCREELMLQKAFDGLAWDGRES